MLNSIFNKKDFSDWHFLLNFVLQIELNAELLRSSKR